MSNIIRGTTPPISINITGLDSDNIAKAYLTFKQENYEVTKTLDDMEFVDNHIFIKMTQEETLGFAVGKSIKIQLKAMLKDGEVVASRITYMNIDEILKEEVI